MCIGWMMMYVKRSRGVWCVNFIWIFFSFRFSLSGRCFLFSPTTFVLLHSVGRTMFIFTQRNEHLRNEWLPNARDYSSPFELKEESGFVWRQLMMAIGLATHDSLIHFISEWESLVYMVFVFVSFGLFHCAACNRMAGIAVSSVPFIVHKFRQRNCVFLGVLAHR